MHIGSRKLLISYISSYNGRLETEMAARQNMKTIERTALAVLKEGGKCLPTCKTNQNNRQILENLGTLPSLHQPTIIVEWSIPWQYRTVVAKQQRLVGRQWTTTDILTVQINRKTFRVYLCAGSFSIANFPWSIVIYMGEVSWPYKGG